ncbi:hypothetical protein [Desulfolucanica intricata]|nr:hypothetical protein [Desulfolucanica intricata]
MAKKQQKSKPAQGFPELKPKPYRMVPKEVYVEPVHNCTVDEPKNG